MNLLPVVTKDTATSAICDILREEMHAAPDQSLLVDWVLQVAEQNPAVLDAVNTFLGGSPEREKSSALMGMAITYRILSAQAEIEELNKMAGPAEPFAGILKQFEEQSAANYRAVNGIQMTFPRADFQEICRTGEPDRSAPFDLPAGPYDSAGDV